MLCLPIGNLRNFYYVVQESVMVRAYSVGCITIHTTRVFSGPPMEEWNIQFHASAYNLTVLLVLEDEKKTMKTRNILTALMLLLVCAGTCTIISSCSKDDTEENGPSGNNSSGSNNNEQQNQAIVVTVDAYGNADGGHRFTRIDDTNFYIDDIKYTAVSGNLEVTGYNEAFFKGAANIISTLIYVGRNMSVVSIANEAFKECKVLTSVVIPNSVTSIDAAAFWKCTGLTSIAIPNNVTRIGSRAFEGCSALTSITIPESVTSIDAAAFRDCSNLTSITIPESVTSIARYAFEGCSHLNSVHITDLMAWCTIQFDSYLSNPLYYAHHLYLNGKEIIDLIVPNGVTSIARYAFEGCSALTSVTIPNSVTSIGLYAFYGCTSLTSITIPNSVTRIDDYAFRNCSNLTSITIPESVTSIGNNVFDETAWYNNQPDGVVYVGNIAYTYKGTMPEETSITLKDGTLGIAHYAFYTFRNLRSVTIPNSVVYIGDYAFAYDGRYGESRLNFVYIGSGVKTIGEKAFYECNSLTSVYCYATTPPETIDGGNTFVLGLIRRLGTLHVPAESVSVYKATYPWNEFKSIVAIE